LIIALGVESFPSKAGCRGAIAFLIGAATTEFNVYQDFQQTWRWHLKAANGQVVAISGETYVTRQGALESVALALSADADTPIEEVHDSGSMRAIIKPTSSSSKN
jgi:uncharacterized protein YegP (UPF0339 family)